METVPLLLGIADHILFEFLFLKLLSKVLYGPAPPLACIFCDVLSNLYLTNPDAQSMGH